MTYKLLTTTITLLLFTACSQIDYKGMYDNQTDIFDSHTHTQIQSEQHSIQNVQNPMRRPSYDEYMQQ